MKDLFKDVLQEALDEDVNETLGYGKHEVNGNMNNRKGYSKKTIESELGPVSLNIPSDRQV